MSISATAIWCIAAIILLGAEMMAGTIYLLICAIACFTFCGRYSAGDRLLPGICVEKEN